ncbi:hypothetical protein PT974_02591 [Cladobotryum mycophilum]|uniref:Protein required for cell viability n=1 Tax=Cladobotryum mycophilum TaxID=491253 RepID=A0ABR0SYQ3_9HYPO
MLKLLLTDAAKNKFESIREHVSRGEFDQALAFPYVTSSSHDTALGTCFRQGTPGTPVGYFEMPRPDIKCTVFHHGQDTWDIQVNLEALQKLKDDQSLKSRHFTNKFRMEDSSNSDKPQPKFLESIIDAAKNAFNPSVDITSQELGLHTYNELIERTSTWVLLHALNTLIKPNVLPPWLRTPLMQTLTLLPLRPDGVRGTMEFVFAVHPSNNGQPADTGGREKEGVAITHEAVAVATKLLSSVPSSMSAEEWFQGVSGQLFALLDGEAGADIARTAAQVVGFGILGKKQFGAPGAPGWNAFVQPLLATVNPSLKKALKDDLIKKEDDAEVINLSKDQVIVANNELEQSLLRLELLIISNPSPGLCKRVLKPILLQLWSLASWINPPQDTEKGICKPARGLIQTYLRLFGNADGIEPFIHNLLCRGSLDGEDPEWRYHHSASGGIDIVKQRFSGKNSELEVDWSEIEIFLNLLRRWIQTAGKQSGSSILISSPEEHSDSAIHDLIDVTILQKLMEKAPEKLVSHFDQLLELICQVLQADSRSSLGDDIIGIILSLLNLVITAPTFQKSDINASELKVVEESLERIEREYQADASTTARNLAMLLKYRDEVGKPSETSSAPTARQIEDRKTYNLAMNYITGDENEDFINLRVIKIFTQLASKHPRSTMQELLDHYLDGQERSSTDVRLRFGEAILQVVERLGEIFSGEAAENTGETLLSIAGRRGYRPKTMAKQAREERLDGLKRKKAEASGGVHEDIDMNDEEETADQKAKNDILAQILKGWESKRGSEDIRMRTSALSIFGNAIETNIIGMGPTLVSTGVDLSINILTMEPELEKGILRRAAILLILSFVRALDKARETGQKLGFGLTDESRQDIQRTLNYVAATDNDGLVQQHAQDVVESLENWGMASLLPTQAEASVPGFAGLAGLRLSPGGNQIMDGTGKLRPRIEEIE